MLLFRYGRWCIFLNWCKVMLLISWGHYFRSEENISPCIVVNLCSICSTIQLKLMLVGVGPGSNQTQSYGGSWWQLGVGPGYWLQIKHKMGWAKLIWANWIKQLKLAISAGSWLAWAWLASQAPWSPEIKHALGLQRRGDAGAMAFE
jgi:hypothetical protein